MRSTTGTLVSFCLPCMRTTLLGLVTACGPVQSDPRNRVSYPVLSLFDLILYVPVNNFSVRLVFLGLTSTKQDLILLAKGHNAVTLVKLEPATPRPRVQHFSTEPLSSISHTVRKWPKLTKLVLVLPVTNTTLKQQHFHEECKWKVYLLWANRNLQISL